MQKQTTSQKFDLTTEQQNALNNFAAKHGRTWRSKLRSMWFSGADANQPDGAYLRQVRNQQPPAFLDAFKPGA
jgi:hypothetical protein